MDQLDPQQRPLKDVSRANFSEQYGRACRGLLRTRKDLSYDDEALVYLVQQITNIIIYPNAPKARSSIAG